MCNDCNTYTPYHVHSSISNFTCGTKADCVTNFDLYLGKAKEMGIKSFGFAEHGNVINHLSKKRSIEKHGMKYIHAVEAYLTDTLDEKVRDNYHWVMIAKNYEGYLELNNLISNSFNKDGHFYYNPRISMDEMMSTSDNIIMTSACLGSPLWQYYKKAYDRNGMLKDKVFEDKLDNILSWIKENNHRVFLEIQYHKEPEQIEYNRLLLNWSHSTGAKLIAGTDTHALDDDYAKTRKVYLDAKQASYGNEDEMDLTLKSYDGLVDAFEEQNCLLKNTYLEAIHNTNIMADMIEPFEHNDDIKYPQLYKNPESVFKNKINKGFIDRGINKFDKEKKKEYLERIKQEYDVYKSTGAINYMLLQEHITTWCRDNGIYFGYSRGSVSGSLIAYLLGITDMDSVKHKLNFSRFMNPHRVSLADIDIDFPPSKRQDVIDFVSNIEGLEFAEIITVNTVKLKGAIRDIGRGLGMELKDVDEISKAVKEFGGKETISDSYRNAYPELFSHVDRFIGTHVSMGSHPSGFMVSTYSLKDHIGTLYTKDSKYQVSSLNMKEVESLNYVKLDILGLKNIELINTACDLAGIERLTPDNVDDKDEDVWKSLYESTFGVFQFDKGAGSQYVKRLFAPEAIKSIKNATNGEINYMTLLSIANGAIRPAGDSYRDALVKGEFHDNGHDALNEALKDNLGRMIFQEDIINFLSEFCGFTDAEADNVRRAIGKKLGTEQYIDSIKEGFIKTMNEKYGEDTDRYKELAKDFVKIIEDSSDYGFSLNHSQSYSYIGYICAYLREHYPLEFMASTMTIFDKEDEQSNAFEYAKLKGIKINNIKFGNSDYIYKSNKEENAIYKGIGSIKYMNKQASDKLLELSYNTYNKDEFYLLCKDIMDSGSVDKRQMEILINLNFFSEFGKSAELMEIYMCMKDEKKASFIYTDFADSKKVPLKYDPNHTDKTKEKRLENIKRYELVVKANPPKSMDLVELLRYEKENLGYSISTYPNIADDTYVIIDINDRYTPLLELYNLQNGSTVNYKIKKNNYWRDKRQSVPAVAIGDIVKVIETKEEFGWKKVDNDWIRNESKIDTFITKISIIRKK